MNRLLQRNGRWLTATLVPGQRVYRERLHQVQGHEYREWSVRRSKLAAYLELGGRNLRLEGDETALYLGAASGTTVSHLSDLLPRGRILAVEFSSRPFRDLLAVAATRRNVLPVLADASHPDAYAALLLHRVPLLYQDIAQRHQARIFLENARHFLAQKGLAFLAVKARSINVARAPQAVYEDVKKELHAAGFPVIEQVDLGRLERDHAMLVVRGRN